MTGELLCINRLVRGGVYYITLNTDKKCRPYLIISKDAGYGKSVIGLKVTSRFKDEEISLPIVFGKNKVSFIDTSFPVNLSAKDIMKGDFTGIIQDELLMLATNKFGSRFLDMSDNALNIIHEKEVEYCNSLENAGCVLRKNTEVKFTTQSFFDGTMIQAMCEEDSDATIKIVPKENIHKNEFVSVKNEKKEHSKFALHKSFPHSLRDWNTSELYGFKHDLTVCNMHELMKKYKSSQSRIAFIRRNVNRELDHRKRESNA